MSAPPLKLPSWATANAAGLHGNTAPGRIRLIDLALSLLQVPEFIPPQTLSKDTLSKEIKAVFKKAAPGEAIVIDVGVGDDPSTTVELALALTSTTQIIGTEVDGERLANSEKILAAQKSRVQLRLGTTDFTLPQVAPSLVRAMNVLRDYPVPESIAALRKLYWQVKRGGLLVEGSAETEGRVAVAMVMQRGEEEEEDEVELPIDAVIFAADLDAIAKEEGYADAAPASWFNRHNHLPRLVRGFCTEVECKGGDEPAWVTPMRTFLERWEAQAGGGEAQAGRGDPGDPNRGTVRERFVRGARGMEAGEEEGTVVAEWADRGILVWLPGGAFVVPDVEEWDYYRQRVKIT